VDLSGVWDPSPDWGQMIGGTEETAGGQGKWKENRSL